MKKHFLIGMVVSGILLTGYNLFACPSGKSCPAGKDCVADSSLCVADSSSTSSSSSEPTTAKDQLGLTLILGTGLSDVIYPSIFLDRTSVETGGTAPSESPYAVWSTYNFNSLDAQNAPTPSLEGGIWGLGEGVTVH